MSDFGHIYSFLKGQLFRLYCCSFHGAPLWYLKSDGVQAICVTLRKALRTIYKMHPATHCDIITALSRQMPLLSNLARFGKFFKKCREHKNNIVKAAATAALVNPMSCAGRNYIYIHYTHSS